MREEVIRDLMEKGFSFEVATEEEIREFYRRSISKESSGMETQTYQRKPSFVEAVRVTEENFFEVAQWCQGAIISGAKGVQSLEEMKADKSKFIKVRVINPQRARQTKAFVGDWVLYSEYTGYKVYTADAFKNAFVGPIVEPQSIEQAIEQARKTEEAKAAANGRPPENVPDVMPVRPR